MINSIISFSVKNRMIVLFLTFLIAVAGAITFNQLPIDAVPDVTNNQVQVNTTVEGLAPEEIERTVTYPIESSMRGIAGVEQVRSITRFGLSQVTIVFQDEVEIYRARQMVSERLSRVLSTLPKNAHSELGPISSGLGEIYQYVIEYEKIATDPEQRFNQLVELRSVQDWFLKPRLMTVPGIAEVNTSGGYEKQFHVKPEPKNLAKYGVYFEDIQSALQKANVNVGGGYVEQSADQFLIQAVGIFESLEDIKKVPVKSLETFKTITVDDVAEVSLGKELRTGASTYNGNEALLGTVMMLMGENSRSVATKVHDRIQEIAEELPGGMKLKTVYNRSDLVNATLKTVEHNLFTGAALVVVILILLVGNLRAAFITALTIPLSLLITFLIMKPFHLSGNLMSLGALDFGIIVDGVVIVVDNCVRRIALERERLKRALSGEETREVITRATTEIRKAAGFGQLIIVVVFIPIFGLTGIEGKMFRPMAGTFVIALFAAMILSFTTAPALASILLSGKTDDREPRLMIWVRARYEQVLHSIIDHQKKVLAFAIGSILLGVILFMRLGGEFLPQLSEGSFAFHMIRPANINLTQSLAYQKKAEQIIGDFPEVDHVFSRLGTSEVATDPMGVNVSDTYIMLKDRSMWASGQFSKKETYEELASALVERLELELPGMRYLASQPIQMRFNELLEGTRADVTVKIFGPDLDQLVKFGAKVQQIVSKVKGAADVEVDLAGKSPVLKIEPRSETLNRYGTQKGEVLEVVSTALGGEQIGYLYEKNRRYPIVVRMDEKNRSDLEAIKALPVGVGGNHTVPLSELSRVRFAETYSVINREDSNRRSAVLINLRGRDTESFVNEAKLAVESTLKLPEGYYIEWGGNFKNLQEARSRLLVLTPIALILVLFMLYVAFGSGGETFLIFSCVPLALVGGVLGLMFLNLPFSISAGVGFIALSGIAVLNGVVLVNYYNQLRVEGHLSGKALVTKGALIRLRPVLMTALVDIFGFIPMAMSSSIGAEVQRPLAAVVIGGVISSTVLTLLVTPCLFLMFEKRMTGKPH